MNKRISKENILSLLNEREWISNGIADDFIEFITLTNDERNQFTREELLQLFDNMYGFTGNIFQRYYKVLISIKPLSITSLFGFTVFEEFRNQLKIIYSVTEENGYSNLLPRKETAVHDGLSSDQRRMIGLIERISFQDDDKTRWIEKIIENGLNKELTDEIKLKCKQLQLSKDKEELINRARLVGTLRLWMLLRLIKK